MLSVGCDAYTWGYKQVDFLPLHPREGLREGSIHTPAGCPCNRGVGQQKCGPYMVLNSWAEDTRVQTQWMLNAPVYWLEGVSWLANLSPMCEIEMISRTQFRLHSHPLLPKIPINWINNLLFFFFFFFIISC